MKKLLSICSITLVAFCYSINVNAQQVGVKTFDYTVKSGDSLWKLCLKYQIGVSEIATANPHIADPNMIFPGEVVKIPNIDDIKSIENQVITLVNSERSSRGFSPLISNWQLSRVARYKAEDMRDKNYFSHTSPTYGTPFNMLKSFDFSYSAAGENIAKGQQSPAQVMSSWMNSAGHRQNILSANYTDVGVGVAKDANGAIYWVQMFVHR